MINFGININNKLQAITTWTWPHFLVLPPLHEWFRGFFLLASLSSWIPLFLIHSPCFSMTLALCAGVAHIALSLALCMSGLKFVSSLGYISCYCAWVWNALESTDVLLYLCAWEQPGILLGASLHPSFLSWVLSCFPRLSSSCHGVLLLLTWVMCRILVTCFWLKSVSLMEVKWNKFLHSAVLR